MGKYSTQKTPFEIERDLAVKYRVLRKQAGLSQDELARRSGVSLGSLKRFENSGKISLKSFLKLLAILDRLDEMENLLQVEEHMEEIEKLFSDRTRKK